MKGISKVLKEANKLEEMFLIAIFILMILTSFAQVVNRNWLQLPLGWLEELALYCQVYVAFLAMELGLRDGSQISLTAIMDRLHGRVQQVVSILAKLVVVSFTILIFVKSIGIIEGLVTSGQRSPGLKIPMFIPYMALPISFGIAALVQTVMLLQMLIRLSTENKGQEEVSE